MSAKPPFFPFYPKDFTGDELVMAMCTEGVGAYIRLLCAAWVASPPATIPDNDTVLARIAGLTPSRWSELKAEVLAPWSASKDGRYTQERLAREYRKAAHRIQVNRKNGRRGGRPTADETEWITDGLANPKRNESLPEPEPPPEPEPDSFGKSGPPAPTAMAVVSYAAEVARLPREGLASVRDLFQDFGWEVAVAAVEYLASRRPTSFKTVKNWGGFLRKVFSEVEAGDELEPGPRKHEPFENWRARREAEIGALR